MCHMIWSTKWMKLMMTLKRRTLLSLLELVIQLAGEWIWLSERLLFNNLNSRVFIEPSSAAEDDPNCSIYGMPVLRVWKSHMVFVLKRTVGNTGYAGMENPILFKDNVEVVLGDAHETCEALRSAI
jgi:hypothetical protein